MIESSTAQCLSAMVSSRAECSLDSMRRAPLVKPVNVAGCRDCCRSSTRPIRQSQRDSERKSERRMKLESCVKEPLPSVKMEADRMSNPLTVATKLRRRLKGIKGVTMLKCMSTKKDNLKEKEVVTLGWKSVRDNSLSRESSMKIRALFPEEPKKKTNFQTSISKLKESLSLRSRSTTPPHFSDLSDPQGDMLTPKSYANGIRRCRQENLVKMMEKNLEEIEQKKKSSSDINTDHRPEPMCNPPTVARQSKAKKIRRRVKARKAVHRRTATC